MADYLDVALGKELEAIVERGTNRKGDGQSNDVTAKQDIIKIRDGRRSKVTI